MTAIRTATPGPAQAGPVVWALTDYEGGITAIDTDFVRPRLDASHLVVESGRAAFIDTGTTLAVPRLLAALEAKGLPPAAVDWVLLTHIHLDHAGGAGALLGQLPKARVVVHPRGLPHLASPSRLIAATEAVYGAEAYARLYGEMLAIEPARMLAAPDGFTVELAGRRFEFLHTPGHALHHCAIVDHGTGAVFCGDTFGVSYRDFDVDGREFVFPATTPTQFDPAQLDASVDRVLALKPPALFLTHYARVTNVARLGADLHGDIAEYVAIARRHARAPDPAAAMCADLFRHLSARLDAHGFRAPPARRHELLDMDIDINVAGLLAWNARVAG